MRIPLIWGLFLLLILGMVWALISVKLVLSEQAITAQGNEKNAAQMSAVPVAEALSCPLVPTPPEVVLEGGEFVMGAHARHREEGPAMRRRVAPFSIDRTEVTNAQFAEFVEATGYVTQAEQVLDSTMYPGVAAEQLVPSSLVFVGIPADSQRTVGEDEWWKVVPGADWRHPQGPDSSLQGLERHPVVHVSYRDALAYAQWRGRDLPSEEEWEFAARAGLTGKSYEWGDEAPTGDRLNFWQGVFPYLDRGEDGYTARTAPVGCFTANGYGLYDMSGNVWEWTHNLYPAHDAQQGDPIHVIKGGSFLCADNYCHRYRPAARQPGPPDSGASHIGFRTVLRSSSPYPAEADTAASYAR